MRAPAPWAIEGVAVPRALRKALAASDEKPCDRVLFLTVAHVPTTTRQDGMAQSVLTVFEQIVPELIARGVIVEFK